nr:CYP706V7 protein [Isodon rubescens]
MKAALLMAALILTLAIIWFFRKMIKSGEKGAMSPPGPRGLPIVGYLPFLRRDIHCQLTELAAHYGPIYKIRAGSKLYTVIGSTSLAKEVFRDNDVVLANRDMTIAAGIATLDFNDIAWSPYGPGWRDRRKVFSREMLSHANLKASYNLRKDTMRRTIGEIYADKARTPIGIFKLGLKIDLDLILNMVWGGKIGAERRDKMSAGLLPVVAELLDLLFKPNISDFFPVLARFDFQGIAKAMTAQLQKIEAMTEDAIEERIKNPNAGVEKEGRKDFMQTLVELMQEESYKSSLGIKQIKGMLVDILIGGTDTTSTTVEWVMTQLLRHPKVMKKVQQELDEVVGMNNIVEETHMPKLVYLDAVIKETMRLNPIGPLIARTLSQSCTVGGYTIPKDSSVFVNVWSLQRDPVAWDDPSEFKPERFLEGGGAGNPADFSSNNFNFIPFGSGRRMCAGLQLAERMMMYILGSLLHSFEWRLRDGDELDMSEELVTALRKRNPLYVVPIPRLPHPELYN